jgi:hypothetical protein
LDGTSSLRVSGWPVGAAAQHAAGVYAGIPNGRRVVLVNPADIEELALVDRQLADCVSTRDDGM